MSLLAVFILLISAYIYESHRIHDARLQSLRFVVETAVSITSAYETDERTGRMSREAAQKAALNTIRSMRYSGSEYLWVNDMRPVMLMHPIKPALEGKDAGSIQDANGKKPFAVMTDAVKAEGHGVTDYLWPRPGSEQPVPKMSYVQGFAPWGWVIGTGVYVDDLSLARLRLGYRLVTAGAVSALLVGVVIWQLGRSVARPVRSLTASTERLARGEHDVEVVGITRGDELGVLARALDVLKGSSVERARLEREAAGERASKDRRQAAMDLHIRDFSKGISAVLAGLADASERMRDTAIQMTDGVQRTRDSAAETARASESASRDLATVASATVELSASVDEIARQVADTGRATQEAVGRTAETDAVFARLTATAETIDNDGNAISAIAAQTNLLALNATIEAARAGDAGKGFAVVAGEVKILASQTAQATTQIGQNVEAIRKANSETSAAIHAVAAAVARVSQGAAVICAAIEEQGAVTREIASSVQKVAQTSGRTAATMSELATIAESTGEMSRTVLTASNDIGNMATKLGVEVDQFLALMTRDETSRLAA